MKPFGKTWKSNSTDLPSTADPSSRMDFFQSQEDARRRSRLLLLYFSLAIVGIILVLYAATTFIAGATPEDPRSHGRGPGASSGSVEIWNAGRFGVVSFFTLAIVLCGSGFKTLQLMRGGGAIARDLGGRPVDPATSDFDERQLLNIVTEMAIASGCPVPEVFVLEDESINAFAAGKTPGDAVIGVTRGCIRTLNRDELQGVIAHEFSHILNGDMRLNLRITSLLFGILLLALLGQILLRVGWFTGRSSGREGIGAGSALAIIGISLYVIGYIGVIFARIIKAALSRQREFLADASAVQFTRNPKGIGGALKKIGGVAEGSLLTSPKAEEASHMFFANGLASGFSSILSSHPPLDVRIRKIDPNWDGVFPTVPIHQISQGWKPSTKGSPPPLPANIAPAALTSGLHGEAAILRGFEGPVHKEVEEAHLLHQTFPEEWLENLQHPGGAQAVVLALLIASDKSTKTDELRALKLGVDTTTGEEVKRLAGEFKNLHSGRKLALIDIAIPTLRRINPSEYERFRKLTETLIRCDGQVDLYEFALQKVLTRHLDPTFSGSPVPRLRQPTTTRQYSDDASILLSSMAGVG